MKRLFLIVVIFEALLCNFVCASGGDLGVGTEPLTDGTMNYPWLIEDFQDFLAFCSDAAYWDDYTRLECDLDLSVAGTYAHAPIAFDSDGFSQSFNGVPFSGHFDGNRHVISNLSIVGGYYLGLFGNIDEGGTVINLSLKHVSITKYGQNAYVGALCGRNGFTGSIISCSTNGDIKGSEIVGGLCGLNEGIIESSFATGSVGEMNQTYHAGGLCGVNLTGTIRDCYSHSSVKGSFYLGGFVGCSVTFTASISNCYSTGHVKGDSGYAGFAGHHAYGIYSCFWDTETSETDLGADDDINDYDIQGKTTDEMMTKSTFTAADWDFSDDDGDPSVWKMDREAEDYPRMVWQEYTPLDFVGKYGVGIEDFAYLSKYWGLNDCGGGNDCGLADLDENGNVGIGDLIQFIDNWLAYR